MARTTLMDEIILHLSKVSTVHVGDSCGGGGGGGRAGRGVQTDRHCLYPAGCRSRLTHTQTKPTKPNL